MADYIYLYSCFILVYKVISTFIFAEGISVFHLLVKENTVFHRTCDASQAFSVTFGQSVEKCISDCRDSPDCALSMFQHRMKQCALFDSSIRNRAFQDTKPLCIYIKINVSTSTGSPNRTLCKVSETFDRSNGVCRSAYCQQLQEIDHAEVLSTTTKIGSVSRYKCTPGYIGIGNPRIICQTDATWRYTNFSCIKANCPVPFIIQHTEPLLSPKTKLGSTINYKCLPGYLLSGKTEIHCQLNATWTATSLTCTDCAPAKDISNAVLKSTETLIGTETLYECKTGYLAVGNAEIRCQMNATWSHDFFFCLKLCSAPRSVPNAQLVSVEYADNETEYKPGTKLYYSCNLDYYGEGNNSTNICHSDGNWHPRNVKCCKNDTVSDGYRCYRAFSMEIVTKFSEVSTTCKAYGLDFTTTDSRIYKVLTSKGHTPAPWMLYKSTKSAEQMSLINNCLSKYMNATEVEEHNLTASYDETRQTIIENGWNKHPYYYLCRRNLINDWYQGEPNGSFTENCIARGPESRFKLIDISCKFLSMDPYRREDFGFTCFHVPPNI